MTQMFTDDLKTRSLAAFMITQSLHLNPFSFVMILLVPVFEVFLLTAILKLFLGDDIGMPSALMLAFGTLLAMFFISLAVEAYLPDIPPRLHLVLICAVTSLLLGTALSLFFGTPLKSSCSIAVAFVAVHFAIFFILSFRAIDVICHGWEKILIV